MTLKSLGADRIARAKQLQARDRAQLHALRMGLDGDDFALFMRIFDTIRDAETRGLDTYSLWRTYLSDDDASVATAAYLEGIASTRKPRGPQ